MELRADFERAVEEMEWGELVSTLQEVIHQILGDTPNPPPLPRLPPPVPAGLEPVESQRGGFHPHVAAPSIYYGPGHLHSQTGAYRQGQYLPHQWPVVDRRLHPAAAPPHPCNVVPVVRLPEGIALKLRPFGVLNGEVLYEVPADDLAPLVSAAPPPNTSNSKKRKSESQQEVNRPYVKKPPNAFMLFVKEQRPNVAAELNIRQCAALNAALGQRWKSLTKEEQEKYYEQAEKEKVLHAQRHPEWSCRDNYGKKRKRQRVNASADKPREETRQAQKLCVTPVQTGVTLPVYHISHLPQVYEVSPASWLDFPGAASTSLASPAAPTQTQTVLGQSEDGRGQVGTAYCQCTHGHLYSGQNNANTA